MLHRYFFFSLLATTHVIAKDSKIPSARLEADKTSTSKVDLDKQLIQAAEEGNVKKAKELIDAGANVNATGMFGDTVLIAASKAKSFHRDANIDLVKMLIAAGANVNTANKFQKTALMEAAEGRNITIVRTLLAAGADVKATNSSGKTALIVAQQYGYNDIANAIENPQEDLNDQLVYAANFGKPSAVKALIAAEANVNAVHRSKNARYRNFEWAGIRTGDTALMLALKAGLFNNAKILIEAGADVNAANKAGETPLMYAVENVPLHIAIPRGGSPISGIKTLLAAGATVEAANKYGDTAITLAERKGLTDILDIMKKK